MFAPRVNQRPQAVYTQQITLKCALACERVVKNTKQYTALTVMCAIFSHWEMVIHLRDNFEPKISNQSMKYQNACWYTSAWYFWKHETSIQTTFDSFALTMRHTLSNHRMHTTSTHALAHNIYFTATILQMIDIFSR